MSKVVIIGCGNVGMSYAYALLNQRTNVTELVLIDKEMRRVEGEVMDLNHCLAFGPSKIKITLGDYSQCQDAHIVCIAAGANQKPGETRMDLIEKNSSIFKSIVSSVVQSGFQGIFLIATNPLDVMTDLTYRYSKFPPHRVIGTGTSLDTARLRYMIGEKLNMSPKNVHAYVIGEHGDSEFVNWSHATIGLQAIEQFLTVHEKKEIAEQVKQAAYRIIERKGATYYGIGMCLVRITNAILGNEKAIITVSTYYQEEDLFIGLPAVIGNDGIQQVLLPHLTEVEKKQFQFSVDMIKQALVQVREMEL